MTSWVPVRGAPSVWRLSALTAVSTIAISLWLPALPAIATDLSTSEASIQLSLSLFFLGFAAGQPFYGSISDRVGRLPVLHVGLLTFASGSLLCALAYDPTSFMVGRFIEGLGACACPTMSRAMARDQFEITKLAKVYSRIGSVIAVSPALAPLLGSALLAAFGWRSIFVVLTTYALLLSLWYVLVQGETNVNSRSRSFAQDLAGNLAELSRNKSFLGYAFVGGATLAAWFLYVAIAPSLFMTQLKFSPVGFSYVSIATAFGYFVGTTLSARLVEARGSDAMIGAGLTTLLAVGAWIAVTSMILPGSAWTVVIGMAVFQVGQGLLQPNSSALALAQIERRMAGTAASFVGFVAWSASALLTTASGTLSALGSLGLGLGILAIAIAATLGLGLARSAVRKSMSA